MQQKRGFSFMVLSLLQRKTFFIVLMSMLGLSLFSACGSNTPTSTGTTTSTTTRTPASTSIVSTATTPTQVAISPTTATVTGVIKLIALVGQPKAKMLAGTTFEVNGMVKNGDSKQHDIFLQATLFDASGAKIASTVIENVDNIKGGSTVPYSIQGSTTQPKWARIQVTIIKVTENIGGSDSD
jgi:hypothetical protein